MFDSDPGYSTPKLVIKAGDVVIWTNVGEIEHTVTSAKLDRYPQGIMEPSGEFNSGYMKPGMSFAIKFTQKGEVIFKIGHHFNKIRFQIEDTGLGIAEEHLEEMINEIR